MLIFAALPLCLLFQHGMVNDWWAFASNTKRMALTENLTLEALLAARNTINRILLFSAPWHVLIHRAPSHTY